MPNKSHVWSVIKAKYPPLNWNIIIPILNLPKTQGLDSGGLENGILDKETNINRIRSDGKVYTWKEVGVLLLTRTTIHNIKHGGVAIS